MNGHGASDEFFDLTGSIRSRRNEELDLSICHWPKQPWGAWSLLMLDLFENGSARI
jgi:hypothetical protein